MVTERPKPKTKVLRNCDGCGVEFETRDDRFCKDCRKAKRAELAASGYLTKVPWRNPYNSSNNFDPHIDEQNPSFENGIRASEEGVS